MSLNVSEEAIQALHAVNNRVREVHKELLEDAKVLITTYGENKEGLGQHNSSIEELLNQLVDVSGDEKAVKKLVKSLTLASNIIREHIEHDLYKERKR